MFLKFCFTQHGTTSSFIQKRLALIDFNMLFSELKKLLIELEEKIYLNLLFSFSFNQ